CRPRHARFRKTRVRHDRIESRPRLRSGGAVRRHEAIGHRPRGGARGIDGVLGNAIRVGELVNKAVGSNEPMRLKPSFRKPRSGWPESTNAIATEPAPAVATDSGRLAEPVIGGPLRAGPV